MKKRSRRKTAKSGKKKIIISFLAIELLNFFLIYSTANHFLQNQTNIQPINSTVSITGIFFLFAANLIHARTPNLPYIIALFICSSIFIFLFCLKMLAKKKISSARRIGLITISFFLILGGIAVFSSPIILAILQADQKAYKEVGLLEAQLTNREKAEVNGMVFDYKTISQRILEKRKSPQFILREDVIPQRLLFTLLAKKKSNFYYAVLVRNKIFQETQPNSSFAKAIAKKETILFPDFSLFVNTKDFDKLTDLGYSIGNVLVSDKYNQLFNNQLADVNFSLFTQEEYVREIRKKQEKIRATLENQIAIEKNNIEQIQIDINNMSLDIADLDRRYSNAVNDALLFYSRCVESTINYYNPGFCSSKKNELDEANRTLLEYKEKIEGERRSFGELLRNRLSVLNYWETIYREFLSNPRDPYTELGSFNPPNIVLVTILPKENGEFPQYILTVVHEFLHYTSYKNDRPFNNRFFEESTTEYLSRKIVSEAFKKEIHSESYELAVEALQALAKKLPEEKLEKLYFKKDEEAMVGLIDKEYGQGTYSKISSDLTFLLYASPFSKKAQALKQKVVSNLK